MSLNGLNGWLQPMYLPPYNGTLSEFLQAQKNSLDGYIHTGVATTNTPLCGITYSKYVAYSSGLTTCPVCKHYTGPLDKSFAVGDLVRIKNEYVKHKLLEVGEVIAKQSKWYLVWWPSQDRSLHIRASDLQPANDTAPLTWSWSDSYLQNAVTYQAQGVYTFTLSDLAGD